MARYTIKRATSDYIQQLNPTSYRVFKYYELPIIFISARHIQWFIGLVEFFGKTRLPKPNYEATVLNSSPLFRQCKRRQNKGDVEECCSHRNSLKWKISRYIEKPHTTLLGYSTRTGEELFFFVFFCYFLCFYFLFMLWLFVSFLPFFYGTFPMSSSLCIRYLSEHSRPNHHRGNRTETFAMLCKWQTIRTI